MSARQPARFLSRRGALACGLAALGGLAATPAASALPARPGEPVRWPRMALLDQGVLDMRALQGRAAVVVFFMTTCPFCQRHNRHVQRLAASVPAERLLVLGAALERDPEPVRRYMARHGHSFPVTLDDGRLRDALSERRMVPLTCVIDRAGRLREVIPGEMSEADVLGLARWAGPAAG